MSDEEWAQRFADEGLAGWLVRQSTARTEVSCGSFTAAGALAAEVTRLCDEQDHHAEIDIRFPDLLRVTTWSHDVGGLSERDVRLAKAVDQLLTSLVEERAQRASRDPQ